MTWTAPGPNTDVIADYAGFDFESLWKGREKVTRIELALLESVLGPGPCDRVLEIGTGFGRLSPTIRALSREYVGVDFDPGGLARARARVSAEGDQNTRWALANLHHLPFRPASFSAVVMVRLAHHVPRWEEVAHKLADLLEPGGRCLVTVAPSPTLGTLAEDVKRALRGGGPGQWSTFARGEDVRVCDSPHPIYVGSRNGYRLGIERAGLRISRALGSGLEDLVPGIPARSWVNLAPQSEPLPWFPIKWYVADRPGPTVAALPPIDAILACPRCRTSIGSFPRWFEGRRACAICGFEFLSNQGFPDLRYLAGRAVITRPTVTQG